MKARVLVTTVSVGVISTSTPWDRYGVVPGSWSASGIVVGQDASVSWDQRLITNDPMPLPGSYVELELEPETWRVANP